MQREQSLTREQLSALLSDLASRPSAEILDALRGLERKTSTVFTLLKASVYSIVLQQEIRDDEA
jgi:DASH complex subunit DAD3